MTMGLNRKAPTSVPEDTRPEPKYNFRPIVDADYIIYSAGMAGQYSIKHFHRVGTDGTGKPLASFRYVKEYKAWLEELGYEIDRDVYIILEDYLEPLPNVLHTVKTIIQGIWDLFGQKPELYLTGEDNFREDVAMEIPYKGNRWSQAQRDEAREAGLWTEWLDKTDPKFKETPRPKHKKAIMDYMCKHWGATIINGMEADDKVAMVQYEDWSKHPLVTKEQDSKTCIIHVDKDINMVPGWHYNPSHEDLYYVDELEGMKFFYKQVLTGDAQDNIPGLYLIGPKKADKIIDYLYTDEDMKFAVVNTYSKHKDMEGKTPDEIMAIIENRSKLLWMVRE